MKPIFTVKELREALSKMDDADVVVIEQGSEIYPFRIKVVTNVITATKIVDELRLCVLNQKYFKNYEG